MSQTTEVNTENDTSETTEQYDNETIVKSCRFYENKYPEVDDYVVVKVKSIADMGAYVSLLEYDNIEGMILFSELSRRRIRSVSKLIRVGRQEVCVVLRVDKEKGYIDLSKRRVDSKDLEKAEQKFNKSKAVHSIMRHLAETLKEDLESLYQTIAWPLYKKFGHAYDAFKLAMTEPDKVLGDIQFKNDTIKKKFLEIINIRLKPQPVKIRADIEVTCFSSEGIDTIKAALKEGEKVGTEQTPVKIQLVAPPLYVIFTTALDKTYGVNLLNKAIEQIKNKLTEGQGELVVKTAPRAVTARDDHSLSVLLEQLREQNKQVDGDELSDED